MTPVVRATLGGDPLEVAPALLGVLLVRTGEDGVRRAGRIVEVEAYRGESDPASHAYRGRTPRTAVMFGPPGHLYVYRSYGIHWCANVVCGSEGVAAAVLVRALEPVDGIPAMYSDRPKAKRARDLANGPGKLCAALGITGADGGSDLCAGSDGRVRLFEAERPVEAIERGPRIGISVATEEPWRFWISESPYRSR